MINEYNDYMEAFANLPKEDKKREIIKKSKELQDLMFNLSDEESELLLPSNIVKLEESFIEDNYYEAIFAHFVCLEDLIAKYLDKTIEG